MNVEAPSLRQEDQFRELFGVLRRRKAIVLGFVTVFAALGVVSVSLVPASYQVTARVLVNDYFGGPQAPSADPIARVTQMEAAPEIGAQVLAIGAVNNVGLVTAIQREANSPQDAAGVRVDVPPEQQLSIQEVAGSYRVVQADGPALNVVVDMADPVKAAHLAAAVSKGYNQFISDQNATDLRVEKNRMHDRLQVARTSLQTAQQALEKERANQGDIPVTASQGEEAVRTTRLDSALAQLDGARVTLATAQQELVASTAARAQVPEKIRDISVRPSADQREQIKAQLNTEQAQLKSLLTTYTEKYPEVMALRARMRQETQTMQSLPPSVDYSGTVTRNPEWITLNSRVTDAQIGIKRAQIQVEKYEALVASERKGVEDYRKRIPAQLKRQASVDEAQETVRSDVAALAQLDALSSATSRPRVTLVGATDATKTQPVVARTLLSSTLVGLILGIMIALFRDRFDNRIYTLEQIYDVSGAVPIGQVPSSVKALALNAGGQNRNRVLESYRSLRFNLESSGAAGAAQSVLVASASAGEGRAGLSLNLATEAATDARRTILVDGDMRAPELHDLLKVPRSPGLSDVLSGTTDLESVLRPTGQDNLFFLPAGTEHANPLELLVGPSFASVHEALKERADVIVLNSPSLMRYTDARAIANVADSVLFVAKRGFTRRDAMRYCIGMLRRAHARLLGVVLSDDAARSSDVPYMMAD